MTQTVQRVAGFFEVPTPGLTAPGMVI